MQPEGATLERDLAQAFVTQHPNEAASALEALSIDDIIRHLEQEPAGHSAALLEQLEPEAAAKSIAGMQDDPTRRVLPLMNPSQLAALLARLDAPVRDQNLALLDRQLSQELQGLLSYPPDTAGQLMDARFNTFRANTTVAEVTTKLSTLRKKRILDLILINENSQLVGLVSLQDVILAEPEVPLSDLVRSAPNAIHAMAPREEVVEMLTEGRLTTLPVVDLENHVLGVIRHDGLMQAVREEATIDLQRMVGVGKEERALSSPWLSVKKRLPWLNINLLTAFLAAAVVGIFEDTIAKVTALAILLPVVAGQSGNTGAQALAVTMRGLALREVRTRHWPKLIMKEAMAGLINGVAIAIVTAIGVFIWSHSIGLALVICVSMVISMVIAGIAGATIPIVLSAIGQDPAQSSSIILTTVTDVMGFFAFLGLASLFASYL